MNMKPLQIAFITGRSDPDCWLLSPLQSAFIQQLAMPERRLITYNFPYVEPDDSTYRVPPLLTASYHNTCEYLLSRRSSFISRYQSGVLALLEQAPHTLFLAGSCGLELFNNLKLPAGLMNNVSIFAYGPVARRRPECNHRLVQGSHDVISRFWFRQADSYLACGHLDYLSKPQLLADCQAFINRVESGINPT